MINNSFCGTAQDDGVEVRHGALALRQLGIAVTHCKLEPLVANFMKVICSQGRYTSMKHFSKLFLTSIEKGSEMTFLYIGMH